MKALIQTIYRSIDRVLQSICGVFPKKLRSLIVRLHRMLTYGFMGCINTALDYAVFYLLYKPVKLPIELCQAVGMLTAAAHGYMLNSNLTFSEGKGRTRGQFVQYVGVDVALTLLGSFFMGWIERIDAPVFVTKLGVAVTTGLIHYAVYKIVVFRIKKDDKSQNQR